VKWKGRESNLKPPSSTKVRNACSLHLQQYSFMTTNTSHSLYEHELSVTWVQVKSIMSDWDMCKSQIILNRHQGKEIIPDRSLSQHTITIKHNTNTLLSKGKASNPIAGMDIPWGFQEVNPLKPELNPICYLLALSGAHYFLHVSRIRVKLLTLRLLMSYIYIWSNHSWCF